MGINEIKPPRPDEAEETLLEFPDNRLLIDLCGPHDSNLARIERELGLQIMRRGNRLALHGPGAARGQAADVLRALYERLEAGHGLEGADVGAELRHASGPGGALARGEAAAAAAEGMRTGHAGRIEISTRKKTVSPRSPAQEAYLKALLGHEMSFGIGPAGTGKTYLAVAVGVNLFIGGQVDRIVLSRPAVEAGERLGFLPGDMKEKVDPYMQPLYDALHDFLPGKQLARLLEEQRIEIAPLAFMRGRTLSNAFVLLDEAQNATPMQMKMFLTRMGEGSRMVITGDRSQVDLPRGATSGLAEAVRLLSGIKGISFTRFGARDVVRHPLVAQIIEAYERQAAAGSSDRAEGAT